MSTIHPRTRCSSAGAPSAASLSASNMSFLGIGSLSATGLVMRWTTSGTILGHRARCGLVARKT